MLLTHDEDERAICLFVDLHDKVDILPIIMDERICCDTAFRVTRLGPRLFVVSDIRYLNGKNLFETLHFEDRNQLVTTLLETFHHPELTACIPLDDVAQGTPIRGTEYHTWTPATMGVFLPANE
jgi:hypothetical protein